MAQATNETIEKVIPIVNESDFPEKSSRLRELIQRYHEANNLPTVQTKKEDPLEGIKVVNGARTHDFEHLNENDKKKVIQRIEEIDYHTSKDIQTFGSVKKSKMTQNAKAIISQYKMGELGELAEPITELVATLKSNNPRKVLKKAGLDSDKKVKGLFFGDLKLLKNAKKKMFKALSEHETVEKNLQDLEIQLEKQQFTLGKDIYTYENMGDSTFEQAWELELDCIALQLMIEEAQRELQLIIKDGEVDSYELQKAKKIRDAIERMERKMEVIQNIRISTIQSIPQLAVLIKGNEIIYEKIDEIKTLIIPLWSWQYSIAIGALRQKESLNIQKTVRGITSILLRENAKMLHDNMIAAQEELYASAIAIEDLAIVQEYIDDMVTKVNEIRMQASQKTTERIEKLQAIEDKNYALMAKTIGNV